MFVASLGGCADGGGNAKNAFAKAAPSIVVVIAQDILGEQVAQGSGIVVGESVAVTNCDIVEGATEVRIRQATDVQAAESYLMSAEVVALDEEKGLCLLHAPDLSKPPAAKAAAMDSAKSLVIGEDVYAIGAPQGLELSLSRGIVTQLRGVKGKAPIVKTDAAISPGLSGGGLFNRNGELVGVITFNRKDRESLNFAMPVEGVVALVQTFSREIQLWQSCAENPQYQCAMELAQQITRRINDDFHHASALQSIASAQAKVGDIDGAKQTVRQIGSGTPHARASHAIAVAQIKAGNIDGAKQTIKDAKQVARKIESVFIRDLAYASIADAQAEVGDISGAKQTAQQIEGIVDHVSALRSIVAAQAKAGDISGAKQTIGEAQQAAQQSDDSHRVWAWGYIVDAQAGIGDIDGAKQTAQQIDTSRRARALSSVAVAQAEGGNTDGAKQTAQQIDDSFYRAMALGNIAVIQAKAGNISGAKQIISDIRQNNEARDNAEVLNIIAAAQIETGNISGARQTINVAKQIAMQIEDVYYKQWILGNIVTMQSEMGDFTGAMQAVQSVDGIDKVSALASIAEILAKK